MNTVNFRVLSLLIFALTSFQLCFCDPVKTQRKELKDTNSQNLLQKWLREPSLEQADDRMAMPYTNVLQKRIFMGTDGGRDAPKSRYSVNPAKPGSEFAPDRSMKPFGESFEAPNEVPEARQTHLLQKRIFMGTGTFQNGDSENIPHASDLEKLLSLRDRARALHRDIDQYNEQYRNNDEGQENTMTGEQLDRAEWEEYPDSF